MVNTLLNGFLTISMKVLDFFLAPISTMISNSGLHNGFNTFTNNFSSLMTTLKGVLPWVIDATGIPKPVFILMFGVVLGGIGLRISVFVLKIVVKWWDRIIA